MRFSIDLAKRKMQKIFPRKCKNFWNRTGFEPSIRNLKLYQLILNFIIPNFFAVLSRGESCTIKKSQTTDHNTRKWKKVAHSIGKGVAGAPPPSGPILKKSPHKGPPCFFPFLGKCPHPPADPSPYATGGSYVYVLPPSLHHCPLS